jgi:hydroxymethylpyrimidine pyrophosphatase-like HAD family hydrolase
MVVSFDMDNTVTSHPELADIANSLQAMGHTTLIVTGRKSDAGIMDFLHTHGFPQVDDIVTKAGHKGSTRAFKEKVLKENNVDVHFDDQDLNLPSSHPTKVMSFQTNKLRFGRSSSLSQER